MRLDRCHNVEDLRVMASRRAHRMVFDYIDGAADDEVAIRNNRDRFGAYDIVHRVLTGAEQIDLSTVFLGHRLEVPFFLSPSAGNRLFHSEGERAVALAAAKVGAAYSLSTLSTVSMEEIAALSATPKFFQLYVWKDRGLVREMLERARAAGYSALILTVDMPIAGNRERDLCNRFTIPPKMTLRQIADALQAPWWTLDYLTSPAITYANHAAKTKAASLASFFADQLNARFDWADAEWLLSEWSGPSILKGVVHPEDAARAAATGFDAIMISNHGGRQLDASPAPIDMLKPIRDRVGNAMELVVDGGVRRATDIIKAMALGANAVSFARPYLYGLAAGGQKGVERALDMFVTGLRRDMVLTGAASIGALDESFLRLRDQ